jgi:aspartate-semialdehyde dehydrogenase
VGREFLDLLERRDFPVGELRLMASGRSAGTRMTLNGSERTVEDLASADPAGLDLAFFSAGGEMARAHAPRFAAAGAIVVDNSAAFREDPAVPLVVPEVNAAELSASESRIIANPNCSTIILLLPLAQLHRAFGLSEVVVATYQSVSGAGKAAVADLFGQVRAFASGEPETWHHYDRPIFLNLIPQIGDWTAEGDCLEERKMIRETWRILGDDSFPVYATCVRVPVERCHSEAILVRVKRDVTAAEIADLLRGAPGIALNELPTPRELIRRSEVFVGRIRVDEGDRRTVRLWVVSDQLWKGAALNAIQIAERLIAAGRLKT